MSQKFRVVIIGGGFGGLFAAQHLTDPRFEITLIDKRNFHLFQPLLYQVATGGLSPGDIASPLRAILKKQKNTRVLQAEVSKIDPSTKKVHLVDEQQLDYDYLIVATGARHHYFGNRHWSKDAPGLKTLENALDMRRRVLDAFEKAEKETNPGRRRVLQRFVIVGAGPTGVELAGALGELTHATMKGDFRNLSLDETEIILVEGTGQVLPSFPNDLALRAENALARKGVKVKLQTRVTEINGKNIVLESGIHKTELEAETILWAAGVKASPLASILGEACNAPLDRNGRVIINPDLTVGDTDHIFCIGDMAHFKDASNEPLPGVAPVAMQQGKHVAKQLKRLLKGESLKPFKYTDKGALAVIGRNAAVAKVGKLGFSGFPAWLLWAGIHIHYLIEFGNKFVVSFQWFWNYITRKRGARLITDGIVDDIDNAPQNKRKCS